MASSSRTIPHLLEPYLLQNETQTAGDNSQDDLEPEPELVIATSVLGASTNWLILRYLYSFLKQTSQGARRPRNIEQDGQPDIETTTAPTTTSVVLVSFLRDFTFWKENAGRIGLDLESFTRAGRFAYVDGLGVDLFHSVEEKKGAGGAGGNNPPRGLSSSPFVAGAGRLPAARPNPIVPGRQPPDVAAGAGAIPPRGGPASPQGPVPVLGAGGVGRIPASTSIATSPATNAGASSLTNPTISHLRSVISSAMEKVRSSAATHSSGTKASNNKVVLIIDQLDFLLAASCEGFVNNNDEISTQALRELLLDLRETTTSTILTLSADQPLIEPQSTTLEKDHANFVLSLLHEANLVLSLRLLDTGVAKDVSGVIRITAGGASHTGPDGRATAVEENEYLYHVRGDGSVRVSERGQ